MMMIINVAIVVMCMLNFGGGFNMFLWSHPQVSVIPVSSIPVQVLAMIFMKINKKALQLDPAPDRKDPS